jgi:hypothetical protein
MAEDDAGGLSRGEMERIDASLAAEYKASFSVWARSRGAALDAETAAAVEEISNDFKRRLSEQQATVNQNKLIIEQRLRELQVQVADAEEKLGRQRAALAAAQKAAEERRQAAAAVNAEIRAEIRAAKDDLARLNEESRALAEDVGANEKIAREAADKTQAGQKLFETLWPPGLRTDDSVSVLALAATLIEEIKHVNALRHIDSRRGFPQPPLRVPTQADIRKMVMEPGHPTLRLVLGQLNQYFASLVG